VWGWADDIGVERRLGKPGWLALFSPRARAVGDRVIKLHGADVLFGARANRRFLGRVVRYLAEREGVRQFLDIGTGLPSANNTHEVAQAAVPDAKAVRVDNDPIVLAHARALLTSAPQGKTAFISADLART